MTVALILLLERTRLGPLGLVLAERQGHPSRSPSSWDRVTAWLREATPSLR